MLYEILKALHIVAVIAWMGGAALPAAPVRLRQRREGAWQSEILHNRVAWFLADVLTTRPLSSATRSREKVPQAICTRTAFKQT
jgi:hypothetical protein